MSNRTETIKSYLILTLGLLLNALGWAGFLIPSRIVGGGVSGAGTVLYYATGIPVGLTFLVVNALLLGVSIKALGRGFGVKTIYAVVTLSGFLSFLQPLFPQPLVKDAFMATILGGALAGAGVGIALNQGGSTGGTDIVAMLVNKYRDITVGKVILYLDLAIIASSFLVFHSVEKIVYGYVTMAITAYGIDQVMEGARQSVQLFIFSQARDRIADRIGNELKRGVTFLRGRGWYSGEETEVVVVVVRKYETHDVFRVVKEEDPAAFISVSKVMGVYGKGFEAMRR